MNHRQKQLLAQAVRASSVATVGNYTEPRTWGVYEISPPRNANAKRCYRFGNHPVRQRELEAEFGAAGLLALFRARELAQEYVSVLNAEGPRG